MDCDGRAWEAREHLQWLILLRVEAELPETPSEETQEPLCRVQGKREEAPSEQRWDQEAPSEE